MSTWIREHRKLAAINFRHYRPGPPIPVRYRVHAGLDQPGAGPSWPITRNPGWYQWATLEPAADPLQMAN